MGAPGDRRFLEGGGREQHGSAHAAPSGTQHNGSQSNHRAEGQCGRVRGCQAVLHMARLMKYEFPPLGLGRA